MSTRMTIQSDIIGLFRDLLDLTRGRACTDKDCVDQVSDREPAEQALWVVEAGAGDSPDRPIQFLASGPIARRGE